MGNDFNEYEFLEFGNLYTSLKKCCKNVRWKTSVTQYEHNGLKNTTKIINEVNDHKYRLSKYQVFEIYEPKQRTILATKIKDRHLQRSLCDNYLYKEITRHFIYDNCACQLNKGTHFAIRRLKAHLQKLYHKHKHNNGYYLKCDIHHFFESINHEKLKELLIKNVRNNTCRKFVFEIIDSFGKRGLGLGSQVSQLLALLYLDPLDHFIKEKLHIKHYIRYMDDFILIHTDRNYLNYCLKEITKWLVEHDLTLNSKTCLQPLHKGVIFLNFKFMLTNSGKTIITSSKVKIHRRKRKLHKIMGLYNKNILTIYDVFATASGMLAHLEKYNTYKEQLYICKTFNIIKRSYLDYKPK